MCCPRGPHGNQHPWRARPRPCPEPDLRRRWTDAPLKAGPPPAELRGARRRVCKASRWLSRPHVCRAIRSPSGRCLRVGRRWGHLALFRFLSFRCVFGSDSSTWTAALRGGGGAGGFRPGSTSVATCSAAAWHPRPRAKPRAAEQGDKLSGLTRMRAYTHTRGHTRVHMGTHRHGHRPFSSPVVSRGSGRERGRWREWAECRRSRPRVLGVQSPAGPAPPGETSPPARAGRGAPSGARAPAPTFSGRVPAAGGAGRALPRAQRPSACTAQVPDGRRLPPVSERRLRLLRTCLPHALIPRPFPLEPQAAGGPTSPALCRRCASRLAGAALASDACGARGFRTV